MSLVPIRNPLFVALDVDDEALALSFVDQLADLVGGFKIGPRLIHKYGQNIVKGISKRAPVFVDCKFFDIPSTMTASVRASFEAGASFVTVHSLSGHEALTELANLEKELNQQRSFQILSVTILTSWSEKSLPQVMKAQPIQSHVRGLAEIVKASGLSAVVCSAEDLNNLKDLGLFCVVPGIRISTNVNNQKNDDQIRTATPQDAIAKGASMLVVGRPILEAKDPRTFVQQNLLI